jgi:putative ABC transport system permease protein
VLLGAGLSKVLVSVLSGVFDPPPSALAVPWAFFGWFVAALVASAAVGSALVIRGTERTSASVLRQ